MNRILCLVNVILVIHINEDRATLHQAAGNFIKDVMQSLLDDVFIADDSRKSADWYFHLLPHETRSSNKNRLMKYLRLCSAIKQSLHVVGPEILKKDALKSSLNNVEGQVG